MLDVPIAEDRNAVGDFERVFLRSRIAARQLLKIDRELKKLRDVVGKHPALTCGQLLSYAALRHWIYLFAA